MASAAETVPVSDLCLWEIAIKRSTGKLRSSDDLPRVVTDLGFDQVSISRSQIWAVRDLPFHHRDPFDRLLVAQARDLGVPIVTADHSMAAYDVAVLW
jgi:PIN domain nuclease of toxin-antitoxin system